MPHWKHPSLASLLAVASLLYPFGRAIASEVVCHENKRTNAYMCINEKAVSEDKNGIRYAALFSGGPRQVRKTPYEIHTNCTTGVTHLKDRDGVSFAGGSGFETEMVRELRKMVCEAPVKKKTR